MCFFKNAIERENVELAQNLPSVSIFSKKRCKGSKTLRITQVF